MDAGILVAVFPSRTVLTRALDHLTHTAEIELKRAAIVAKAKTGEIVILDDDLSPTEGAWVGGVVGGILAALGMLQVGFGDLELLPSILVLVIAGLVGTVIGLLVGRFVAKQMDMGIQNDQLEKLARVLEVGHPALVLETDDISNILPQLRRELSEYQAELIETLQQAISTQAKNLPAEEESNLEELES